jgi:hypothetical protein
MVAEILLHNAVEQEIAAHSTTEFNLAIALYFVMK